MKFSVNSYHFKLLRDYDRIAVFKEAIEEYMRSNSSDDNKYDDVNDNNKKNNINECNDSINSLAFDLGCGSGVLSYLAKDYFDKIVAIELSSSIINSTKENLKSFDNINVYHLDVLEFDFNKLGEKADLIICEMLDTALIDEEEVLVLDYAKKFLKEDGEIIPQGIINFVEPIFMNNSYIQYEDDEYQPIYLTLGESKIYSEFNFLEDINCNYETILNLEVFNKFEDSIVNGENIKNLLDNELKSIGYNKIKINGIKITTFTKLNNNIICGPTPMLNPCMLIPIDETEVSFGDTIKIKLEYVMGGGIESIKTEVLDIIH